MPVPIADAAQPPGQVKRADALTRHAVTIITAFIFSFRVSRGCDLRHRVADSVVDAMAVA